MCVGECVTFHASQALVRLIRAHNILDIFFLLCCMTVGIACVLAEGWCVEGCCERRTTKMLCVLCCVDGVETKVLAVCAFTLRMSHTHC